MTTAHTCDILIMLLKKYADLAHLVERDLAKVEVAGSSPVIRSIKTRLRSQAGFFVRYKISCDFS